MKPANKTDCCYHCGQLIPPGLDLVADINGAAQPMCCPGCQAVAMMITGSGLESFYQLRTEYNTRPDAEPVVPEHYRIFDDAEQQGEFVSATEGKELQAELLVSNISCAACTWLIEHALLQQPGITHASVNLGRQSLTVNWHSDALNLSRIFMRLEQLGYPSWPWRRKAQLELIEREQRHSLRRLAVAGLAMMQVGMFAIALHAGDIQGMADPYRDLMRWVSLLIATIVVFYSASVFFRNAWNSLRQGHLIMDVPVALAIGLAWSASAYATWSGSGQVYFDSVAMFTFFLLLGRYLEQRVRQRDILRQTDLQSLLPATVRRRGPEGWETAPCRAIAVADQLLLSAGQVIPADGLIVAGRVSVDESAFSGESLPRSIGVGDEVMAGALVLEGNPEIQVIACGDETRLARMLDTMHRAQHGKPQVTRLADRVAGWFVAALLLIAAVVALVWWQIDSSQALWITLSVLVVSCPCALALATPAALASATSRLRRAGFLLSGEQALEQLQRCSTVVFDKTGTLTRGRPSITEVHPHSDQSTEHCLGIAAALEQYSQHPIANAFNHKPIEPEPTDIKTHSGLGISGCIAATEYRIGAIEFVRELCPNLSDPPQQQGQWLPLATANATLAWFKLDDTLRDDAQGLIQALQARGLHTEMLSGDSSDQASTIARQLGLHPCHWGVSPEQKIARIQQLQNAGESVTMVGDGLNDAAVLAMSDCGIAVNNATDLAKSQADGMLLNSKLSILIDAFETADRCQHIIRQNLTWALAYNAVAIPLAAAGLIPPWAAALGMSASSLLVVSNSLRLNRSASSHNG